MTRAYRRVRRGESVHLARTCAAPGLRPRLVLVGYRRARERGCFRLRLVPTLTGLARTPRGQSITARGVLGAYTWDTL